MTYWTPEMDATLRAMVAAGKTYAVIARKLGVTRNAAIGRGHRLGLDHPCPRGLGMTIARGRQPMPRTAYGPRLAARKFDYDEARRRWFAGEKVKDIAAEYGVHYNALYQAFHRMVVAA